MHYLALLLLVFLSAPASSEPVAAPLDQSNGNPVWFITIIGDDGLTSASATFTLNRTSGVDGALGGDLVGIVDPVFTPSLLRFQAARSDQDLTVGVLPITVDIDGVMDWSPSAGPSLMTGQAGGMPTGDATGASWQGTIVTQFGDVPFNLTLADHTSGDMTIKTQDGTANAPLLDFVDLNNLIINDNGESGNARMADPYSAELGVEPLVREPGPVEYPLDQSNGNPVWFITIIGDDGLTSASATFTLNRTSGVDGALGGDLVGIVDPVFTPSLLRFQAARSDQDLTVGVLPITVDIDGVMDWSPSAGPSLMTGQAGGMPTGDATGASWQGTIVTQFGDVPFNLTLADHTSGDMTIKTQDGTANAPLLDFVDLNNLIINDNGESGNARMADPYSAELGVAGGVTWSMEAYVRFSNVSFQENALPEDGEERTVAWTMDSYVRFSTANYIPEPSSLILLIAGIPLLLVLDRRRTLRKQRLD